MENYISENVVTIYNLIEGESFSFKPDGKVFKVKSSVRKRKNQYLRIVEDASKTKINRKFSINEAKALPVYLKTPLQITQIPKNYITRLSSICNN